MFSKDLVMKKIKIFFVVFLACILYACGLYFFATLPYDQAEHFFMDSHKKNDKVVFYGYFYSMIGVSLQINEDEFKDICRNQLKLDEDFKIIKNSMVEFPVYVGEQNAQYKGYRWELFEISGEFIKNSKQVRKYYIKAVYNRGTGKAFFYLVYI